VNGRDCAKRALEAVLLFHGAVYWDEAAREKWLELTGETECTTVVLCETARAALFALEEGE